MCCECQKHTSKTTTTKQQLEHTMHMLKWSNSNTLAETAMSMFKTTTN